MTGLEIEINGTREYIDDAVQMEDNYPGIHRKAIWEKVIFPGGLYSEVVCAIQKPFIEKKHRELVGSFRKKRENPRANQYVDKVASHNGIAVRSDVVPINPKRYNEKFRVMLVGDLAKQGVCFNETTDRKRGSMDYTRTH